jgi:ATP-dependent DNA helicase Q4
LKTILIYNFFLLSSFFQKLQIIFNSLASLAYANFSQCSTNPTPTDSSDKLKTIIRSYFQSNLPMDVKLMDESNETPDSEIVSDIRQMISMYPENTFSGRSLARLFHGISSPCYPAVIWGRCKYWRAHMNVNFSRLVRVGNSELVKMRRCE